MSGGAQRGDRRSGRTSGDQRSRYERDRDRVLYTREFRRLAGVTQVVRADESYTYHDRLSHSLKVAQIGRRLAEYFNKDDGPTIPEGVAINPDVVETAALAHDIGHPPFGHAAEQELDRIITEVYNESGGFEGNAQSFRIVTRLCVDRGEGNGLDLTYASLNAMLKYPWERGPRKNRWGVNESKKWGVYDSDSEAFDEVRQIASVDKRRSAEADIMDWADDLAYAVHDMEDFYRAGIIPFGQLLDAGSREQNEFVESWAEEGGGSADEARDILKFINNLSGDTLRSPYSGTEAEQFQLKELSSRLISRYLGTDGGGLTLQNHNDGDNYLQIDDYLGNEVSLLKYMTVYYVIRDNSLAAQQRGQRKVIRDLFDILFKTTLPDENENSENVQILSAQFREKAKSLRERGERKPRVRFAADVITGMTEKQATQMHKRLTGDTPGSLHDQILG